MSLGLASTSDVIPFDQNWHHLYSTSAGGKHLSNDALIRVIDRMETEIRTKMRKKLSEKLRANFPATTPGCSTVKLARLNDAFYSFLTPSKPSRRSITTAKRQEKEKKERRLKKNSNIEKPKDVGHFLLQKLKILISAHARARMS